MPKNFVLFSGLNVVMLALCIWHLNAGQLGIEIGQFWTAIIEGGNSTHEIIAREFRIPRMITALITGGDGYGDGDGEHNYGWVDGSGRGCGYGFDEGSGLSFGYKGNLRGDGEGYGYGYSDGKGWSSTKW